MASWEQVKQVCEAVLAKDFAERAAFLGEVCAADEDHTSATMLIFPTLLYIEHISLRHPL